MGRLIVDAGVLIDATRSVPDALSFIEKYEAVLSVSVVTMTELYAGIRSSREEQNTADLFNLFEKFPVTEDIAVLAGKFRNHYGKSFGTGTLDCIVAATAEAHDLKLVTLNKKHYPMIKNILVPYRKH